jgi:hypothetical protein
VGRGGGLGAAPAGDDEVVEAVTVAVVVVGLEGHTDADLVVVAVKVGKPGGVRAGGLTDSLPVPAVEIVVNGAAA